MSGVTYADLVTSAGTQITAQALEVRNHPFEHPDDARQAMADFHAVLDAIESHTWTLIGPSRLAGISATTRAEPVVADAIGMVDGLREHVGTHRPHPSMLEHPDRTWAHAALRLRAASDLLVVHLDHWGNLRSPDAAALGNPDARDAALVRIAGQLDTLLATETPLALRSLQVGVSRTEVNRWLPGLGPQRAYAHHLAQTTPGHDAEASLDGLRLIGEPLRADDPVLHTADLVQRLRQATWELSAHPDYSVTTLRHLATAGLMLHAHTAAAHGTDLTAPTPTPTDPARPYLARAAAWRALHADLTDFSAPGPGNPQIHADVLALRQTLATLAPLDGTPPTDPSVIPLLTSATGATTQIAEAAGNAFRRLATSGHIHIHSRDLSGDHIGQNPDLIAAKLTGALVVAPATRTHSTTDLWRHATGPLVPRPAPLVEALTRELSAYQAHVITRTSPSIEGSHR